MKIIAVIAILLTLQGCAEKYTYQDRYTYKPGTNASAINSHDDLYACNKRGLDIYGNDTTMGDVVSDPSMYGIIGDSLFGNSDAKPKTPREKYVHKCMADKGYIYNP